MTNFILWRLIIKHRRIIHKKLFNWLFKDQQENSTNNRIIIEWMTRFSRVMGAKKLKTFMKNIPPWCLVRGIELGKGDIKHLFNPAVRPLALSPHLRSYTFPSLHKQNRILLTVIVDLRKNNLLDIFILGTQVEFWIKN